jgi:F-box protein, helicase, 18
MNIKEVELTQEQQDIVDFVDILLNDDRYKSMAIKAFAGCGKSFVLKYIAHKFKTKKFLGLAFNNSIYKENKKSFPKRNSKWFTVHGFAKEYLKKFGVNFDFENCTSNYKDIELIHILNVEDPGNYHLGKCINEIMKVYCQSSLKDITPDNIKKAAMSQMNESVILMNDSYLVIGCEYAKKLWTLFEENKISPTFDFYLKYFEVNRYAERITEFDLLELDEAQDSNAVTMSIVTQLPTKNIYVGDEHQSIYGFRGTLNAMKYADKLFYLSTTFRYIPKIADYANKILKSYKNEQVPIKSLASGSKKDGLKAFISRNNSSMIALIADLISKDEDFKTVKDPDDLFEAALSILEFRLEKRVSKENIHFQYLNKFQSIEQVKEYIDETKDNELQTAYKMQQRYGKGLYIFLKKAKENQKKSNVKYILTTAHTSKGLEWDEVVLLNDFPDIPRKLKDARIENIKDLLTRCKKNDLVASNIVQEINLFYVAITRARFQFKYREIEESEL